VLQQTGLKPLQSLDDLLDQPTSKVLIVLGQTDLIDPLCTRGRLKGFLERGGAILIATDRQTSTEMKAVLGVQINGQFISVAAAHAYRGELSDCPLIVEPRPRRFVGRAPPDHGRPDDKRPVATNRPSVVSWSVHRSSPTVHARIGYSLCSAVHNPDRLPFAAAWTVNEKGPPSSSPTTASSSTK